MKVVSYHDSQNLGHNDRDTFYVHGVLNETTSHIWSPKMRQGLLDIVKTGTTGGLDSFLLLVLTSKSLFDDELVLEAHEALQSVDGYKRYHKISVDGIVAAIESKLPYGLRCKIEIK